MAVAVPGITVDASAIFMYAVVEGLPVLSIFTW